MNAVLRSWIPEVRPLIAVTAVLFVVTAVIYPLAITGIGQGLFNKQANGSIIWVGGQPAGSALVGQQFTSPAYFHGRPSAAGNGYDASASGGSNLGPTSADLLASIEERVRSFRWENGLPANAAVPADAVTASGSGLDPHVSPATARLQVARVAEARGADQQMLSDLVEQFVEGPHLAIVGEPRVNVLKLNIELDKRFPLKR